MRDDLENDMMDAFRLGNEDPALAMKRFGRIRSRALAAGRQALATSCLIQMRFLAGLQGDVCEELRLLERIVDEAPNAMHLVSLGRALELNGSIRAARRAYARAVEAAANADPTSHWAQEARAGVKRTSGGSLG